MSNPFVNVTITRANRVPSQAGFGTPLIWTNDVSFSGIKTFSSPDAMLDDVFTTAHEAYKLALHLFSQEVSPEEIKVAYRPGVADADAELQVIIDLDNDWYALITDITIGENLADEDADKQADILDLAAFIEGIKNTNPKLYFVLTRDADTLDAASTTDLAAMLEELGYDRTIVFYTRAGAAREDNRNHAAWVGGQLPKDPGSITWKFKELVGNVADSFTDTELGVISDKKVNIYREVGGLGVTGEGYASSGEFIDLTHGQDLITARIQEYVFGALASAGKIPYTDAGVDILVSQVKKAMALGVSISLYTDNPAPVVTAGLVADQSDADRAARHFPDIRFRATFAGAVHSVSVDGTLSV